jgi:prophage regulatory protein
MAKLIRRAGVTEITSYKRSAIHDRLNPQSDRYDPTFPTPIKLGGTRTNAWVEEEVYAWVNAQVTKNRGDTTCAPV